MTITVEKLTKSERKTRTRKVVPPEIFDDEPMFRNIVTIDPSEVVNTWARLNANTWAAEFDRLPLVIHAAFVKTLKRSKALVWEE